MEKYLENVKNEILCRQTVMRQLYSLIGNSGEPMPESLYVHGHVATAKTLVVQSLLAYLNYNVSNVNCIECLNNKHLFEYILADLLSDISCFAHNSGIQQKCDNIVEFLINLKRIAELDPRPIIVVFDNCDRLRDLDATLLPVFLRLRELANINICTIFISNIVWEKFRTRMGVLEPIKIHFSQYNRDEFAQILHVYKPKGYDDAFYRDYLNLFLSVFLRFCRDLNELRYMAKVNFVKYVEPLKRNQLKKDDIAGLWRHISPIFKSNLEVIYLRVSSGDFTKVARLSNEIESTTKLALSFELPYYAKFMLIAAYLASYNPAKEDKHLFMKYSNKKKRKSVVAEKRILSSKRFGSHNFPVSRMLAIFCAILDEKVDVNANLLAQIPTMCQLGLMTVVGIVGLDEPKVKCCVSYDFVTVIAKTVGFNVQNYLYDLVH